MRAFHTGKIVSDASYNQMITPVDGYGYGLFASDGLVRHSGVIEGFNSNTEYDIWNDITIPLNKDELEGSFPKIDSQGRRYTTHPLHAPGVTENGPTGEMWNGMFPPEGRHWRYAPDVLDNLLENGLIEWSNTGNPRKIVYICKRKRK